MNVPEIRQARAEAARQIQAILRKLEQDTGLVVTCLRVDCNYDLEGKNSGVKAVDIDMELA